MGGIVKTTPSASEYGVVSLVEEGSQLLRCLPLSVLAAYIVGTLPFVLGLLFFWSDMSRSALAPRHCSAGALGLGLLFVWMKCWQTVYCRQISARLTLQPGPPWTPARLFRLAARQSLLQATAFIFLPLAVLFTVPAAWVYAFYQNATVLDDGSPEGLAELVRKTWHQTILWPRQNHLMLLILGAFGFSVFLNGVLVLALSPMLLKRFFGLDTVFTLSGWQGLFNTTFLAVAVALAHVCLDPLIKTLYTLRCFHGRSLRSGEDLRARLARQRRGTTGLMVLIFLIAGGVAPRAEAAAREGPAAEAAASPARIQAEDLNDAIRDVLAQPRYTWRLPRDQVAVPEETQVGWFASFFNWLEEAVERLLKPIERWFERIWKWLRDRSLDSPATAPQRSPWPDLVKGGLVLAGLVLVVLLAAALHHRTRKRPEDAQCLPKAPVSPAPDLNDDQVRADALPVDEWRQLAEQLASEGRFRLAMRACFFSTLSVLADRHLIMLADHKSNREYEAEVKRRAADRPSLGGRFGGTVVRLDRAWYGMRAVSRDDFIRFAGQQREIAHLAEG